MDVVFLVIKVFASDYNLARTKASLKSKLFFETSYYCNHCTIKMDIVLSSKQINFNKILTLNFYCDRI